MNLFTAKTEQKTTVCTQWDRWTSYDMIKKLDMQGCFYQNSCKDHKESTLLRAGLSCAISSLSIFLFSLKLTLSLIEMKKSSKDGE